MKKEPAKNYTRKKIYELASLMYFFHKAKGRNSRYGTYVKLAFKKYKADNSIIQNMNELRKKYYVEDKCGCKHTVKTVEVPAENCYAQYINIVDIYTDEKRFQNRNDAFSEASAQSVAENYDKNKFDAITVWIDPNNKKTYVLSGHSRFEGLKRRGEKQIPVRYFNGSEEAAIKYARVDANRSASEETFLEDLDAFILLRDGNGVVKPAKKSDLQKSFKGKVNKLEYFSYLDRGGKFITALKSENKTEFPFIERLAMWVGELRKDYSNLTNVHESDIFNFLYSDLQRTRMDKDSFNKIVLSRLAMNKERLFPECANGDCKELKDFTEIGDNAAALKRRDKLVSENYILRKRLNATGIDSVTTQEERSVIISEIQENERIISNISRDLNQLEKAKGLF